VVSSLSALTVLPYCSPGWVPLTEMDVAAFDIESDPDDNITDASATINIAIGVGRTIQANKRPKFSVVGLYATFYDAVAAKGAVCEMPRQSS
jgi:hypothetical protein